MKQITIVVVSALLLVQVVNAFPLVKREAVEVAVKKDISDFIDSSAEDDPAIEKVLFFLAGTVGKISLWGLENGSVMIKNAVKDLEKLPEKDELLQANITRMSNIAEEAASFKLDEDGSNIMQLFENIIQFARMLNDYEDMDDDSNLKLTLKVALENNGYEKYQGEFEERVVDAVEEFDTAFGEYVKGWSPEEKKKQAKLLDWYEELTNETDEEEKLDKFGDIFDLL
ncbi:uncharacterized protein LOC105213935 [Zeugodacus cucurbitae]|uniref:uncharacterized protein LOC105213935 n=1 Tax=Zeugodacus cucurbitae TaxID=28588 RepID=UPI0023D8E717|nr:uncharacterized protein LOC105213935 [Zeugodacus cucurbitae]